MRVVLADIKGRDGFVAKDTIAGGYGSRFRGTSWTTRFVERMLRIYNNLPSIQLGYLAAIFAQAGHEVVISRGELVAGDLALVLTSMVDFRNEISWAEAVRRQFGMPVGFFGTFATYRPDLLDEHGDFVIQGEPEQAAMRLARGERLRGIVASPPLPDLDELPFPRWDLFPRERFGHAIERPFWFTRRAFPILSSRSCPEFCTYCPHRIVASYRARSPENVLAEIEALCRRYGRVYLVFRDPIFTADRERALRIAEGIIRRNLPVRFECETRLDDLDEELLRWLHRAGLRSVRFGVESVDALTLKRVGRRPIPPEHQREIVSLCRRKGIVTHAFYVLGFLTDTVETIRATIEYAVALNTTFALFKILTPYPGTPLYRQMARLITENDLEKFDGYTPTFRHPTLRHEQLIFLLETAYSRFYVRPSWLWTYLRLPMSGLFERLLSWADAYAERRHLEVEAALFPG
ncbi:2-hydroxyethylphosphonate methyltransferase [bacterium HR10]|nr:2-hydroxyethylphosphonate methyltransferase [bacterium HR10]